MNEEQNIKQLPEGWKWVKLGDACSFVGGGTPRKSENSYWNGNIFWASVKDVKGDYLNSTEDTITENGLKNSAANIAKPGDVILITRISPGKTIITNVQTAINQDLKIVRPKFETTPKFLHYYFRCIERKIINKSSGTTVLGINLNNLKEITIPLLNISTQNAIVAKIEELLSELDKGIEQLKTAQQQLKTYRQAVLKWAFEGKLTERRGEWKNVRLADIANAIDPQPSHRTPPVVQNGVPFVSIKDFDSELDKIDFTHARRVSHEILNEHLDRYELEIGDFVIGKIGTIGKPVRIVLPQDYCLSANIILIQPRKINTTYLYYFFQSNLIEKAFTAGAKSTTQAAFGIQKVRELRIELPNEQEQHDIVQEIEGRLSVADKMEESITQSLQQAEALRQSILKQAFEGKLVTPEAGVVSLPKPAKVIEMKRKVLAGKIIHLFNDDRNFGLTKFQKTLFLVEHHIQSEYETDYLRDTAGPYDKGFTLAFRKEMEQKGWFTEEMKSRKTRFVVGEKLGSLIKEYPSHFREKGKDIAHVLQLLKDKTTHEAELIATLYAVWNNRLIKKLPVKENILVEEFFNWSPKKREEFQEEEITDTYKWMKEVKLVPKGFGRVIE